MKRNLKNLLLLALILGGARASFCQTVLETAFSYDFSYANTTSPQEFWQNGGSVEVHASLFKCLGAVGRMDALHTSNMEGTGVGLDLISANFGPRYTWSRRSARLRPYGEALGGWSTGLNSRFPTASGFESTSHSPVFLLGGGLNYQFRKHFEWRVFDAHWMRTYYLDATTDVQNTLVAGTGIIFRFPTHRSSE